MRLGLSIATAVAAVAGTMLGLDPGAAATSSAAPVHDDGEGPLSTMSGNGGFISDAPVDRPYWVSVGQDMPCAETDPEHSTDPAQPGDSIVLTGVRYDDHRNPAAEVYVMLRTVTPRMVRRHPKHRDRFEIFGSARGHAGWHQRYGTYVPGHYTRQIGGHAVDRTCAQVNHTALLLSRGKVPDHSLTTLVLAVKTDDDGARVRPWYLDYTINGEPRTLRIRWTVGARAPRTFKGS